MLPGLDARPLRKEFGRLLQRAVNPFIGAFLLSKTASAARAALGAVGYGELQGSLRNRIINGRFTVNQRGVSGTVTLSAGQYGHDRWKAGASGCTYTFSNVGNITTLTITAGSLQQVIEGVNLDTGTHVLSWTGTAQGKIGAGSYSASGVVGAATAGTNLTIEFNAGTLTNVQFESGTNQSVFENRMAIEFALCQRYYQVAFFSLDFYVSVNGQIARTGVYFPCMRATPTAGSPTYTNSAQLQAGTFSPTSATALQVTAQATAASAGGNLGCTGTIPLTAEL